MFDPFAMALDALFNAPGSLAAIYRPACGQPVPIRVIRSQPDQDTGFRSVRIIQSTNMFELRRSEVADPIPGSVLQVGNYSEVAASDPLFELSEPMLDVEGLTWTCGGNPIA